MRLDKTIPGDHDEHSLETSFDRATSPEPRSPA